MNVYFVLPLCFQKNSQTLINSFSLWIEIKHKIIYPVFFSPKSKLGSQRHFFFERQTSKSLVNQNQQYSNPDSKMPSLGIFWHQRFIYNLREKHQLSSSSCPNHPIPQEIEYLIEYCHK